MNEHIHHLVALGISGIVVTLCVALHYEALHFLGRMLGKHIHKRIGVLLVMLGLLLAHVLEIWIFAVGYMVVQQGVGFGDLLPVGAIRMLSAAEGLAGLALITWSASFTFLAMQRFWPHPLDETKSDSEDETK